MSNRVYKIKVVPVRNGVEVQALSRSPRGTNFILDSIVIVGPASDKVGRRDAVQIAAEGLLSKHNTTRQSPAS